MNLRTSTNRGGGGGKVWWHPWPREFPDGRTLYHFHRYGTWEDADIDGLGKVLSRQQIDSLIELGGNCVIYTHLGKRPAHAMQRAEHIPAGTKAALRRISKAFHKRRLMVSPPGDLLDYLVVRDRIDVDPQRNRILFWPDGIRYPRMEKAALQGMKFSFKAKGFELRTLQVASPDGPLDCARVKEGRGIFSLEFPDESRSAHP